MRTPPWKSILEIPFYTGPTATENRPVSEKPTSPDSEGTNPSQPETTPVTPVPPEEPKENTSPFKNVPIGTPSELDTRISNITTLNNMLEASLANGVRSRHTVKLSFLKEYQKLIDYRDSNNITNPQFLAELERFKNLIDQS